LRAHIQGGYSMLIDRDKIEARQRMSDGEKAAYWLRRVVQELNVLEEVTGLVRLNPDLRLVDRLARLGCSKTACDQLEALLNAVDNLKQGSPLAPDIQRLLTECEAVERFGNSQFAATVERAA
jgi:hypothetical protein